MNTKHKKIQVTGKYHMSVGGENEDVIYVRENEKINFYGLADGQSKKKYGALGGHELLKTFADYFEKQEIEHLKNSAYIGKLRKELANIIAEKLKDLEIQYSVCKYEFSSTLVMCVVKPLTGDVFSVQIGDGGIITVTADEEVEWFSEPECVNAGINSTTWLTTGDSIGKHLQLHFGHISDINKIYLLTDGMECICHGSNIRKKGKELMKLGDIEFIREEVIAYGNADDASCILIEKIV